LKLYLFVMVIIPKTEAVGGNDIELPYVPRLSRLTMLITKPKGQFGLDTYDYKQNHK